MKKETTIDNEAVYEALRSFHHQVHDFKLEIATEEQGNALDALDAVLYLAEGHFTEF